MSRQGLLLLLLLAVSGCKREEIFVSQTTAQAFHLWPSERLAYQRRALQHWDAEAALRVANYYLLSKQDEVNAKQWYEAADFGEEACRAY